MEKKFEYFSISMVTALPRFGKAQSVEHENLQRQKYDLCPKAKEVSIYINIPYCRTICQFCMLRKGAKTVQEVPHDFIDNLIAEFSFYRETLQNTAINAIYFGGGTPSVLAPVQVDQLVNALSRLFNLNENIEISFEGEAQTLNNYELLKALKANGVNRISFGLQTLDERLRQLLGRTDRVEDIMHLRENLSKLAFEEINIDYLYNLPGTDIEFLKKDLEKIGQMDFTSVDCHPLKYISCSKHLLREVVNQNLTIPSATARVEMFKFLREWAFANGFVEQLVDQYTKQDPLHTNLYIRQLNGLDGGEYIGFGPGARSHYANFGLLNTQDLHEYTQMVVRRERPLTRIVLAPQVDNYITRFPKRNDVITDEDINRSTMPRFYEEKLHDLVKSGYVDSDGGKYTLTLEGLNWYQNLQEELLAEEQKQKHLENIDERKGRLMEFDGYFENVGNIL